MQNYPKITLTFLTCKRLNLFQQSLQSFVDNCLDLDLVEEVIIVDDNSNLYDRKVMRSMLKSSFPTIPFSLVEKQENQKGQAYSLNMLQDMVKTRYVWHNEDDWALSKKGHIIRECFDIIDYYDGILRFYHPDMPEIGQIVVEDDGSPKENLFEQSFEGGETEPWFRLAEWQGGSDWPAFSFRPGIYDWDAIKRVGPFVAQPTRSHEGHKPTVEVDFAVRYCEAGYGSLYTCKNYLQELDCGHSSFDLNGVNRFKEN